MKKMCMSTIIVLLAMNVRLYAQDDPRRADTLLKQVGELSLELVWEKALPEGVKECVLLDESGTNIFSSQCAQPAEVLQEIRALIVSHDDIKLVKIDDFTVERETKMSQYSKVSVSKNGRNFAVIEHVISANIESGQWYRNVEKSILRLFNSAHVQLAQIVLGPSPNAEISAIGNDKTVVMTDAGEDGQYTNITVFVKQDNTFRVSYALIGGLYPTFLFDYAENGSRIFLIHNDKPVDGTSNLGERIVLDGEGREIVRYTYQYQGWKGWLSPRGNHLVEVTAGNYLVIRDKNGEFIVDHLVQRIGSYHCAFSLDEKYLSVAPGPRRIYLFETGDGEMLWDYKDDDDNSKFASSAIYTPMRLVFVGRSIPGEFNGSKSELSTKIMENVTKGRTLCIIKDGRLINSIGPFPDKGFRTRLQTPEVRISSDDEFLLVQTPVICYVFRIINGGNQ